ncbi:Sphingosine/diacylglycerol kinase-like enzyme [Frankia canadensis]|uniref:Sphingosine/diacylglycerol kinase-like enzyme n=1 Tax=Frankia canadensis TaxID=1836972 RepID=A0A2I2KU72_9ACTN|nr:YegS/Rv2252/BmrU family lipid kinase [Frankia canadensis]SNQ49213.1 Sphingosine/diacylglycerol kinase-like enzyme [Frankia canadensis]SOU56503.1 Sphingosine/diacylglycerol kinase-like enzyme [Frankia canadensis]
MTQRPSVAAGSVPSGSAASTTAGPSPGPVQGVQELPRGGAVPARAVDRGRLTVVVNPSAGRGRALRLLGGVCAQLSHWAADVRVAPTRSLDHAGELAAAASAQGRVVVALGGDGLAGAVAGAVAAAGGVLAVLPGGRGNDFVRGLGLPDDPRRVAAELARAREVRIDLPEVDGRPFLGIASVGYDSDVQVIADRARLLRGRHVYTYAALRALAAWRPARFTVTVDDEAPRELRGWTVGAANAPCYGGGMRFAPDADLTDGLVEVVLISHTSRLTFLALFPRVFSGRHVHTRHVRVLRGRRVRVEADRPFAVYADGDPLATLPATVEVRPSALRLLVPTTATVPVADSLPG